MPICERGAFCYHTTTIYHPDSQANQSNLLNKWKFDLTFGKGSPFSFKALLGKVIKLACSGFPQTVNPKRQLSDAKLCRFFKVLTGSSTIMITRLAIIRSNLCVDQMGSSALAVLILRFCLLHHSSRDYFTPILSRYFWRLCLVSSIIFSHRSVAVQVVSIGLVLIAQGSSLPVPQAIQSMCFAYLKLSMLTRVQKNVCMHESTALQPQAKAFHCVLICSVLAQIFALIDLIIYCHRESQNGVQQQRSFVSNHQLECFFIFMSIRWVSLYNYQGSSIVCPVCFLMPIFVFTYASAYCPPFRYTLDPTSLFYASISKLQTFASDVHITHQRLAPSQRVLYLCQSETHFLDRAIPFFPSY